MNGELAQRMALVGWGNEFIAGRDISDLSQHDTFRFVRSITFSPVHERRFRRRTASTTPREWLTELQEHGVQRLELDALGQLTSRAGGALPEAHAAAFANGTSNPIVAFGAPSSSVWRAAWSVAPGDRPPDNRIWQVSYERVAEVGVLNLPHPGLDDARQQLSEALDVALRFSIEHDFQPWGAWIAEAQGLLTADHPSSPYYENLLPDHGLAHRRLTACVVKSWVFGGMGSWNDVGFADDAEHREYEAVTDHLYRAVMTAIDAVTNAA